MPVEGQKQYAHQKQVIASKEVYPKEFPIYGIVQSKNDPKKYVKSIYDIRNVYYKMIDARIYI